MVAALSATEVQGAKFRERVRQAGGLVVGDSAVDQETLRRAGVTVDRAALPDDRPGYIEIDADEGERVIVVTERDGTRHELHPFLSYGDAKKLPFYERMIPKLQAELNACEDEEQYLELLEQAGQMEERMLRLVIPDMPPGLLNRLSAAALTRLRAASERMRARQRDSGPNAARRDGQS